MRVLLLDTNVLLLFLIGNADPRKVGGKRLEQFDRADLSFVTKMARDHKRHVSLPNVLAETSNLIRQVAMPKGPYLLAEYCASLAEIYEPSEGVVKQEHYALLGLTDAAILKISDARKSSGEQITVVTVDRDLHGKLVSKGVRAINPFHNKTRT